MALTARQAQMPALMSPPALPEAPLSSPVGWDAEAYLDLEGGTGWLEALSPSPRPTSPQSI